jgi:hypothetical protein
MPTFGQCTYTCNREATVAAYRSIEHGGSETCRCHGCRNFARVRGRVFPTEFLALLDELGIDARKDAETYQLGQVSPGRHWYGGWFHFVGVLEATGDFPVVNFGGDFTAWMCRASAPRLSSLEGSSAVQLEFLAAAVPWVLEEAEPA